MVLKQCGETGLRIVGQIYNEYEPKAAVLSQKGLVKIVNPAVTIRKEDKTMIETKELKTKRKRK